MKNNQKNNDFISIVEQPIDNQSNNYSRNICSSCGNKTNNNEQSSYRSKIELDIILIHKNAKMNFILFIAAFALLSISVIMMVVGLITKSTVTIENYCEISLIYTAGFALLIIDIPIYIVMLVFSIIMIVRINSAEGKNLEFRSTTLHTVLITLGLIFPLFIFIDSCILMSKCGRALNTPSEEYVR